MIQQRLLLLLTTCVVIGMVAFAVTRSSWANRPQAYTPQGPGDVYLALGDSLPWGFRLDDRQQDGFPGLIAANLGASSRPELVNLAVPGETSSSFVASQLPRALVYLREMRAQSRSVSPITLTIGGNDLIRVERAPGSEREEAIRRFQRNLAAALDQLRAAAGAQADIAVMTYYNPYGGDPTIEGSDAYWVERLNQVIRTEAGRRGVAVAEVYTAFVGGREYTHTFALFDDVHANAQGHRLIAETFLQALSYQAAPR
ncbi:MAG: SGNH/GDSL hydrolase family protein [Chloroflexia bacterium]|nr:SGNH/GDSL hydrolase family protein [Chloroflexia bacterium]